MDAVVMVDVLGAAEDASDEVVVAAEAGAPGCDHDVYDVCVSFFETPLFYQCRFLLQILPQL